MIGLATARLGRRPPRPRDWQVLRGVADGLVARDPCTGIPRRGFSEPGRRLATRNTRAARPGQAGRIRQRTRLAPPDYPSHHQKVLREAGLVTAERRDTRVSYRADHDDPGPRRGTAGRESALRLD